jgi:hypothetical protein
MDLFKFVPRVGHETVLENGRPINDIISAMWVERYRQVGEFQIKARLSSGIDTFLPVGTIIGNLASYEIMIVETHEIQQKKDEDPIITISGRPFYTVLENRVAAAELVPTSNQIIGLPLTLNADYVWQQFTWLVGYVIVYSVTGGTLERVAPHWSIPNPTIGPGVKEARPMGNGDALSFILNMFAIDDLGLRTIRINPFGVLGNPVETQLDVYLGADKTANVVFSWERGDIESADYIYTNKNLKNAVLVTGAKHQIFITHSETAYARRVTAIETSDLDSMYDYFPTGAEKANILAAMTTRGNQHLANFTNIVLNRVDISNMTQYVFRKDYNLGDLVMVNANFGVSQVMRVIEHVEIEDENGRSSHPTLAVPTNRSRI